MKLDCDNNPTSVCNLILECSHSPDEVVNAIFGIDSTFNPVASLNGLIFALRACRDSSLEVRISVCSVLRLAVPVFHRALPSVTGSPSAIIRALDSVAGLTEGQFSGVPQILTLLTSPAFFYSPQDYADAALAAARRLSPPAVASVLEKLANSDIEQFRSFCTAITALPAATTAAILTLAPLPAPARAAAAPAAAHALTSILMPATPSPEAAGRLALIAGAECLDFVLGVWRGGGALATPAQHDAAAAALAVALTVAANGLTRLQRLEAAASVAEGVAARLAGGAAARRAAQALSEATEMLAGEKEVKFDWIGDLAKFTVPLQPSSAPAPDSTTTTTAAPAAAPAPAPEIPEEAEADAPVPVYPHDILCGLLPTAEPSARTAALAALAAPAALVLASGVLARPLRELAPQMVTLLLSTPHTHPGSSEAGRAENQTVDASVTMLVQGDHTGATAVTVAQVAVSTSSGVFESIKALRALISALPRAPASVAVAVVAALTAPPPVDETPLCAPDPARARGAHPRALPALCHTLAVACTVCGAPAAASAFVWLLSLTLEPLSGPFLREPEVLAAAAVAAASIVQSVSIPSLYGVWGDLDPLLDLLNRLRDISEASLPLPPGDAAKLQQATASLAAALCRHPDLMQRESIRMQEAEWGLEQRSTIVRGLG